MAEKGTPARAERAEPKGGTIIADRYQVDRLIARGGMAAVYLAHHVKLNRPVALKILSPPPDAEDPESFEDRFRLEAETLASLDHPNIVILHDFGETADGRFFLAMEFVDGPRLSDLLRDGPLPVERALNLIVQVCAALRYAHKRGVVHRDLKPSNLLIKSKDNGEEQVKVVDFGLVKLTEADQSITRAGLILGSPHCMAPEQIKGLDVDHRTDIYATGVLLYRTLTGQYPFHGPNSAATMIAHLNQPVPTFFSTAPELVVPAGLEEIVRKCLEKKPEDRYPDMQALIDDLAGCMNVPPEQFKSVSQTNSTIQRVTTTSSVPRTGLILVGAAAVAMMVAVLVAGAGLWYLKTQTADATATAAAVDAGTTPPKAPGAGDGAVAPATPGATSPTATTATPSSGTPDTQTASAETTTTPPEASTATAAEPTTTATTTAKPVPKTTTKTSSKTTPKTSTTPKTDPKAATETKTDDKQPPGYMGLPDDFK